MTRQANKGKKNRSPDKTNRKRGKVFAKAESIHDIYRGQFLDVDGIELPSPLRAGTLWFQLEDMFQLMTLASSGPYEPFLAIHRAFYNKMSVGQCLVSKCQFDATE